MFNGPRIEQYPGLLSGTSMIEPNNYYPINISSSFDLLKKHRGLPSILFYIGLKLYKFPHG